MSVNRFLLTPIMLWSWLCLFILSGLPGLESCGLASFRDVWTFGLTTSTSAVQCHAVLVDSDQGQFVTTCPPHLLFDNDEFRPKLIFELSDHLGQERFAYVKLRRSYAAFDNSTNNDIVSIIELETPEDTKTLMAPCLLSNFQNGTFVEEDCTPNVFGKPLFSEISGRLYLVGLSSGNCGKPFVPIQGHELRDISVDCPFKLQKCDNEIVCEKNENNDNDDDNVYCPVYECNASMFTQMLSLEESQQLCFARPRRDDRIHFPEENREQDANRAGFELQTTTSTVKSTNVHPDEESDKTQHGDSAESQDDDLSNDDNDEERRSDENRICRTLSGDRCIFPFVESGQKHFDCMWVNHTDARSLSQSKCATEIDPETRKALKLDFCGSSCALISYHSHGELQEDLEMLVQNHPEDAELFDLGQSLGNRRLLGIRISSDLHNKDSMLMRPRVKLIGNMHGNEPVGREMLIHFAKVLLESNERDEILAKDLLNSIDLHILPTMNPDGFKRATEGRCSGGSYRAGRLNNGRKDLNRDFPDFGDFRRMHEDSNFDIFANRQRETQLLMKWILSGNFALSANFHDGAVLVNYPWDNYHDLEENEDLDYFTPDHDIFYQMATAYSGKHLTMEDSLATCPIWGFFDKGITNGANWYPVHGGMQDFNYLFASTPEVTMELSCCKYPSRRKLLIEWQKNREALLNFVGQAHKGIKGFVKDKDGRAVQGAMIIVNDSDKDVLSDILDEHKEKLGFRQKHRMIVRTNEHGVYFRMLVDGDYEVQALHKDSGQVVLSDVQRVRVRNRGDQAQRIDFVLNKKLRNVAKRPLNEESQVFFQ